MKKGTIKVENPSMYLGDYFLYADNPNAPTDINPGKWLLFINRDNVDKVWEEIVKAINCGLLGTSAKVSTMLNPNTVRDYLVCVYTYDYKNKLDVDRVRQQLRTMGFVHKIPYKTDVSTLSGVYGKGSSLYFE